MTMKIVILLLLATPALASFESSSERDVRQVRQVYVSRHLEVGAECEADTDALFTNNPDLEAADAALFVAEGWNSTAMKDGCPQFETYNCEDGCPQVETYTCVRVKDFTTMEGHAEFLAACDDAGGELFVLAGYSVKCSGEVLGTEMLFDQTMTNMPTCIATSCDTELVEAEAEAAKAAFAEIDAMRAGFEEMGLNCSSELILGSGGGDSAAPSKNGSFMSLASVAILVVSWFSI
jgi:hypothetical protein